MPRKKNASATVTIRISTTPQIESYLRQLAETGLYGKNPAEAAERLLSEGIRGLLRESFIQPAGTDE